MSTQLSDKWLSDKDLVKKIKLHMIYFKMDVNSSSVLVATLY